MTSTSPKFGKRQTDQLSEADRRDFPRHETSLPARIITPGGRSVRCCIVNISNSGALLMAPVSAVPDYFVLRDSTGQTRRVEVVRRETARVAVRFLSG